MLLKIGWLFRRLAAVQIFWCCDEECCGCPNSARDQRRIADLTDANLKIDHFLHEIAKLIVQDKIDRTQTEEL